MSVDRRLDALIHREVFGKEVVEWKDGVPIAGYDEDGTSYWAVPLYSSDWSGAGEVIDLMEGEGWRWTLSSFEPVGFFREFNEGGHYASGENVFIRVSIAALRAKGVDEKLIEEALKDAGPE